MDMIDTLNSEIVRRELITRRLNNFLECSNSDTSKSSSKNKQDEARSKIKDHYQSAVDDFTAHAKANALAKKKKKDEEMAAIFLLLMLDASESAYSEIYPQLETLNEPEEKQSAEAVKNEAAEFAEERQEYLKEFPIRIAKRFETIIDEAEGEDDKEIRALLNRAALAVKKGEGKALAETEAQATYGAAQIKILQRAGFNTAIWSQLERPTKRDTHAINMELGEKPLGYLYPNGQRYPGDPAGGPGECVNCLCILEGVTRK